MFFLPHICIIESWDQLWVSMLCVRSYGLVYDISTYFAFTNDVTSVISHLAFLASHGSWVKNFPPSYSGKSLFTTGNDYEFLWTNQKSMDFFTVKSVFFFELGEWGGENEAVPSNRAPLALSSLACDNYGKEVKLEKSTCGKSILLTQKLFGYLTNGT